MKITQQTKKTITNAETGEIVETEKEQIINFGRTQDFVMSFTKDLGYLKELSKAEIMVLFGFLQVVNAENEIILNSAIKKRICTEFDININSINVLIANLKKKKVVSVKTDVYGKAERGVYILNTFLFGKGSWQNIKKQRMFIEWDFKTLTKKMIIEQDMLNETELKNKKIEQLKAEIAKLENKTNA